jgi:hypothetical protein
MLPMPPGKPGQARFLRMAWILILPNRALSIQAMTPLMVESIRISLLRWPAVRGHAIAGYHTGILFRSGTVSKTMFSAANNLQNLAILDFA